MERKKIIYVWKSPYPWDVRVEKICDSLSKDYEVLILARWGVEPKKVEQINNITVHRVGFNEKSIKSTPISANPVWKKELTKVIKGFKPDLLIVREIMLGTLVGKLGKKYDIPVIMDMAENYPALMKMWHKYNNSVLKRLIMHTLKIPNMVEKSAISRMSGIIVVCDEQINRLNKTYSYPSDKVVVVKNTPNISEEPKPEFQEGKIIFLHHGWLTEEKKIDIFINSFIEIYGNNNNFELIIAGNGNCLPEYKDSSLGINNIKFIGEYKYSDLRSIISNCSIGILPYEENDFNNYTIHNKLFDYFALSKPVLVSNARPIARIVRETVSGFVVDCTNSLKLTENLSKLDFSELEKLGDNAYNAYITRYNWGEDEKNLLKFVKEFI